MFYCWKHAKFAISFLHPISFPKSIALLNFYTSIDQVILYPHCNYHWNFSISVLWNPNFREFLVVVLGIIPRSALCNKRCNARHYLDIFDHILKYLAKVGKILKWFQIISNTFKYYNILNYLAIFRNTSKHLAFMPSNHQIHNHSRWCLHNA